MKRIHLKKYYSFDYYRLSRCPSVPPEATCTEIKDFWHAKNATHFYAFPGWGVPPVALHAFIAIAHFKAVMTDLLTTVED